jgi:hypothetical protein
MVLATALITTYRVILNRTLYKGGIFLTIWTIWVSKDVEFYANIKNLNLP